MPLPVEGSKIKGSAVKKYIVISVLLTGLMFLNTCSGKDGTDLGFPDYDLPPKNWSEYYVRIREENLQKEAGHRSYIRAETIELCRVKLKRVA